VVLFGLWAAATTLPAPPSLVVFFLACFFTVLTRCSLSEAEAVVEDELPVVVSLQDL